MKTRIIPQCAKPADSGAHEPSSLTRFGVMKHLRVLEAAGLVVTRWSGREQLHDLNPIPIRLIHNRCIDKYTERQVSALADLEAGRPLAG